MGLRLGFQHPSPLERANSAGPGEAGYFMNLRPRPTAEYPLRAIVRTPCSAFVGTTPDEARAWLNHGGLIAESAALYIDWAEQEMGR